MNTLPLSPLSACAIVVTAPFTDAGGGTVPIGSLSLTYAERTASCALSSPELDGIPCSAPEITCGASMGEVAIPVRFVPMSTALFIAGSSLVR